MASKKSDSSEDSFDMDPYISDTRQYSSFITYFVKSGRFQVNSLLDVDRRKGILSLLQAERVIKLTRERRLSPVNVSLTPTGPKQRLYLVAIVRAEIPQEELDDLLLMMNAYIDGYTTQEKEQAVIDLIFSTSSRVVPGLRYLPIHWYPPGVDVPSQVLLDEDNQNIDGRGQVIMDTDEEVYAVVPGKETLKRNSKDVPMPSSTAALSEASTDSEYGPGTYKKKRKAPAIVWPDHEPEPEKQTQPPIKKSKSQTEEETQTQAGQDTQEKTSDQFVEQPEQEAPMEDEPDQQDDQPEPVPGPSRQSDPPSGSENITREEFHNEIEKLFSGFGDLKSYVQAIAENKAKGKSLSLTSTTRTATREDTPEYVKDTETRVLNLFPINKYTEAVDWMLKQPVVQDLIYYETMRTVYRKLPVFKPESNFVIESFMDNTFSVRLQTHCGKATTRVSKADYGRFPLPMIALKIAQENLSNLGKLRVPGGKSVADFIKDRCANLRRTYLIGSDFMEGSDSVQEMAHRMLAERVDFVQNHKWIFDKIKQPKWTFTEELKKTRKLVAGQKKRDDPSFDGLAEPFPEEIELLIFPDMDKGQDIDDMDLARSIVEDLEKSGVTKPTFPRSVWDTIKMVVQPSPIDLALHKKNEQKKAATKKERLSRRRAAYKRKKAAQDEQELDDPEGTDGSDDDDEEEPVLEDQSPDKETESGNTQTVTSQLGPDITREQHVRGLFGSVSDISSETSSNDANVSVSINKEGAMVFTAPPSDVQETTDTEKAKEKENEPTGQLATGSLLQSVEKTGLVSQEDHVMISADKNTSLDSEYSIVIRSPDASEPTVVTQQTSTSHTTKETLTKAPKEKTTMEKYQDLDEDLIDEAAMEGRSSSSSGSDPKNKSPIASGSGIGKKLRQREQDEASHFKTPITVKEGNEMARRSRSRSRSKSKESDKGKVPREKKDTKGTSKSSKSRKHSKK